MSGTTSGDRIDSYAARVQQLDGPVKRIASPSEPARVGIIDEYRLPVSIDSTLIIVDERQYASHIHAGARTHEVAEKGENPLAYARGSDSRRRVCSCLLSRDREGVGTRGLFSAATRVRAPHASAGMAW